MFERALGKAIFEKSAEKEPPSSSLPPSQQHNPHDSRRKVLEKQESSLTTDSRMSFGNLDNLDELGSFDGSDSNSPAQQNRKKIQAGGSPSTIDYNPVGLTIGQISPGGRSTNSEYSAYSRNQSHSVNAVHMHVQENAKIPNFNKAVDRTNSSRPSYANKAATGLDNTPSDGNNDNDNNNEDFSMAELFLSKESKYRRSSDQNYNSLGTLLNDIGFGGPTSRRPSADGSSISVKSDSKLTSMDETQMEIDALTAAIDPTPWSEIERKIHNDEEKQMQRMGQQQQHQQQQQPAPVPAPSHPHHYSYYPYGRHHQLPIPQKSPVSGPKPSPPPSSSTNLGPPAPRIDPASMDQAVATAAAIASTQATTTAPPMPAPSAAPIPARPAPPYTKAQQTTTAPSTVRNYHRQRATYTPPPHAVAHTASRASVIAAASQKSQYGFGGNHTVPSVPAPPPGSSSTTTNKNGQSNSTVPRIPPNLPNMPNLHTSRNNHNTTPPNAGAAYERKKQRAKDARVKLNDAIERLSVAMNFAGSQSKLRNKLLSGTIVNTDVRSKSLHSTEECIKMAEQAKKWDRPSFVGTAASLVQGLNTQCEALMNELTILNDRLKAMNNDGTGKPSDNNCQNNSSGNMDMSNSNGDALTSHPDHKRHDHPQFSSSCMNGHSTKRIKQDDNNNNTNNISANIGNNTGGIHHATAAPSDQKIIFKHVAKMLDPVSLCRCPCVSRNWRDMNIFENDELWLDLAVKRFGFYNVRQWMEKLEDDETTTTTKGTKKKLYRAMNAANIMPHVQQDCVSLLGDAKIPGRVSVWAFMVERSNGETLRSIKREPGSQVGASSAGTYHSSPVVELRLVVQNTGMGNYPIILKNQSISVDVSTRRSGGELKEISWDDRFAKMVRNLDGTVRNTPPHDPKQQYVGGVANELCKLPLFDSVILEVHINARGCSTTSKFQQRSNFTKLLVYFDGTTVPMVIPFLRDPAHGGH